MIYFTIRVYVLVELVKITGYHKLVQFFVNFFLVRISYVLQRGLLLVTFSNRVIMAQPTIFLDLVVTKVHTP